METTLTRGTLKDMLPEIPEIPVIIQPLQSDIKPKGTGSNFFLGMIFFIAGVLVFRYIAKNIEKQLQEESRHY